MVFTFFFKLMENIRIINSGYKKKIKICNKNDYNSLGSRYNHFYASKNKLKAIIVVETWKMKWKIRVEYDENESIIGIKKFGYEKRNVAKSRIC